MRQSAPVPPLVGAAVRDQRRVRPVRRVRNLDEFVRFLTWVEEAVGRVPRPVQPTTGDRFLL